ncbi:MAG: hypothetical protein H6975_03645 [Gammaproteobacteria bacterium]|nr:hypothetical protein [Gammaproteobacteria bacterium]
MPRKDPTFTDTDLIRFYCRNLDPAEKKRVLDRFKAHILTHTPICPNDHSINVDWCRWAHRFWTLTTLCKEIGEELPKVLTALVALQRALLVLSWAGWLGRLLAILRVMVTFLIQTVIYVGALMIMIGELKPFADSLIQMFCFAHYDVELEGDPPDPTKLPESPGDIINNILNDIRDWFEAPFSPDTTTPPGDPWPPEFPGP